MKFETSTSSIPEKQPSSNSGFKLSRIVMLIAVVVAVVVIAVALLITPGASRH